MEFAQNLAGPLTQVTRTVVQSGALAGTTYVVALFVLLRRG